MTIIGKGTIQKPVGVYYKLNSHFKALQAAKKPILNHGSDYVCLSEKLPPATREYLQGFVSPISNYAKANGILVNILPTASTDLITVKVASNTFSNPQKIDNSMRILAKGDEKESLAKSVYKTVAFLNNMGRHVDAEGNKFAGVGSKVFL